MRDCTGSALLRSVIGLENSPHLLNQSDASLKAIATRVFLRFRSVAYIYFEFLLAPCDIYLCSDWPLSVINLVLVLGNSIVKRSS